MIPVWLSWPWASDPDANANVAKIARLLHEGMGFGWCEVGYSGVTFPLLPLACAMRQSWDISVSLFSPISCSGHFD